MQEFFLKQKHWSKGKEIKTPSNYIKYVILDWILYGGGNAINIIIGLIGKIEILEIEVFNVKCLEVDNCIVVT